jgi:outer membrane protein assembly factor BamB
VTRPSALTLAVFLTVTGAPGAAPAAALEDWPQFRGPLGQGVSTERGLPLEWSETRNVLWKSEIPGAGWSSPVVTGGRVWITAAVSPAGSASRATDVSLRVLAFDVQTGRQVVNVEVFRINRPGVINIKNSRASPTPILDGDRVYVHFGADGTAALTTAGEIVWKVMLPYESQHGNGGSPILYRDTLIVSCDGADRAFVIALDTKTGKTRWKTSRRSPWDQAYSTPLVIRVGDRDQVVSAGAYRAAAYDPLNGQELWRVSYPDGFSNVPRPVYGEGLVYIATGFNEPFVLAVRVDGSGDVTKTHVAWALRRGAPLTPSPLLVGAELYIVSDNGIASCLNAKTGQVHWQQRLEGDYSASPVFADGRIYFWSEDGVATVIAPGTVFLRLATNRLDGATLASMAVSGGSLFVRSDTHLYRIGSKASAIAGPQNQGDQ